MANQGIPNDPLPQGLREVYRPIEDEVTLLHFQWHDYKTLFGTDEAVGFLNSVAPVFFADVQWLLWHHMLLQISRITDPPQTGGKENLTILRLADLIPRTEPVSLAASVRDLVKDAMDKAKFARDVRNANIAHASLPPSAGGKPRVLPPFGQPEILAAIESLEKPLDVIRVHYYNSAVSWTHWSDTAGGVNTMLHYLKAGVEAERAKRPF